MRQTLPTRSTPPGKGAGLDVLLLGGRYRGSHMDPFDGPAVGDPCSSRGCHISLRVGGLDGSDLLGAPQGYQATAQESQR